jgi:hypothetical protein
VEFTLHYLSTGHKLLANHTVDQKMQTLFWASTLPRYTLDLRWISSPLHAMQTLFWASILPRYTLDLWWISSPLHAMQTLFWASTLPWYTLDLRWVSSPLHAPTFCFRIERPASCSMGTRILSWA